MAIELQGETARAIILPEYGGRLHQLYVTVAGDEHALLWGPDDPAEYAAHPHRGGCFPMAPWPNRIAGGSFSFDGKQWNVPIDSPPNAIHGRLSNVPWQVVARTARVVELTARFDDTWPWLGKAWQRIELTRTGLRLKMEVRSERQPFPAGCGWHPWFRRDVAGATEVRLSVPVAARYILKHQLPTGETVAPEGDFLLDGQPLGDRRLDDCYRGLSGDIAIDWGTFALSMTVLSSEPHVTVFTPDNAVCVEPQTCAADAFNLAARDVSGTGFAVAEPGRPVSIESRWTWQPPGPRGSAIA